MRSAEEMVQIFRKMGYKITPQRMAIFQILEGNTSHPSADDIFKELVQRHPSMSFTTVYNTLETMKQIGAIQELTIDSARRHYDPNTETHHHIICVSCGQIEDIFTDYSSHLVVPEHIKRNFEIQNHQVQFYGLCSDCQDGRSN